MIVLFDQGDPIERERGQMKGFVSAAEPASAPLLAKYKIAMTTTMLQILYLQSTISQHYGKWGGHWTNNTTLTV